MPGPGSRARTGVRRHGARSSCCAALGALLLGAACGRFGFESISELDAPNLRDNQPDSGGACNLGTLSNCSRCGDDCSDQSLPGVAEYACVSAACTLQSCAAGVYDCDGDAQNGCEAALDSLTSCGACNQPCAIPNAEASCAGGSCQLVQCAPGFGDCDGDVATNGCERELNTLTNCGGCGVPCALANGTTSCESGVCQLVSCANGFGDCDGDPATGCETALGSVTDCGGCGVPCDVSAGQNCSGGVCTILSCAPFSADCDGDDLSCETDLRTLSDCVSCGAGCGDPSGRLANGSASCASGSCGIGVCDPGFDDCDASPGNGCETPLNTLVDCAGCDIPCARANAIESCASGVCQTVSCDAGFADCDLEDSTGCEARIGSDAHCSACNDSCGLNQTCSGGSCVGQFGTFQPSNVDTAPLNPGAAPDVLLDCGTITLNTGSQSVSGWCGRPGPPLIVQEQDNGPELLVLPMRSLQIAPGTTFRALGSRPVALVVFGDVSVGGTIDVSASGTTGGAGNHWDCFTSLGTNGFGTRSDGGNNGGGGGGAFGAQGGFGGWGAGSSGGNGGNARGSVALSPLIPGCNGGWGGGCGAGPGGGGGAVEIAATGRIDITGSVLARGGNGVNGCDASGGATGGGSGGGILIQGNRVFLSGGSLNAEGGRGGNGASGGGGGLGGTSGAGQAGTSVGAFGGGGGGGSTGRIRVAAPQGCTLAGTISPPASRAGP